MGFLTDRFWWLPFGSVPEVTAKELQVELAKTRNRPNLLDVRTMGEWKQCAIKNSALLPVSLLSRQVDTLQFDKDEPIVAICRSATRSIGAVRLLKAAGYTNVRQLQGGIMAWQKLNYPTIIPKD